MSKREPQGLLVVMIDIDPEFEDDFNRWYEEEHLPERMACEGFISAHRYVAVAGEPKYLAIYELDEVDALDSEGYREVMVPSRWMRSVQPHFTTFVRNVYRVIPHDANIVAKRGER